MFLWFYYGAQGVMFSAYFKKYLFSNVVAIYLQRLEGK